MTRKICTILLAVLMLFSVCFAVVACDNETTYSAADLAAVVKRLEMTYNSNSTATESYTVSSKVRVSGLFFNIAWKLEGGAGVVSLGEPNEDGLVTVAINQGKEEVSYTLTATIVDEKGNPAKDEEGKTYSYEIKCTVAAKTASGELLDQFKDTIFTSVETGKAYNLGMYQKSLGKVLYATGAFDKYLSTSDDHTKAATVQLETAEGGYYIYFVNGTAKKYITLTGSLNDKGNPKATMSLTDTASTVFNVHETFGYVYSNSLAIEGYVGEAKFVLGTYGAYNTISASSTYYIEGATNEAKIDVEQFVVRLCTAQKFEYSDNKKEYENKTQLSPISFEDFRGKVANKGDETTEKFAIAGWLTSITSQDYGNAMIMDKNGTLLTVYGMVDDSGAKYPEMAEKPVEGDYVILYGTAKNYNGTIEIVNAVVAQINDKTYTVTIGGGSSTVDPTPDPDPEPASKLEQVKGAMATTVEAGKSYALGLYQKSADKILFANGTLDRFLATTANIAEAATVQVEAAEGGYYIYFLNGTTKKYITLTGSLNSKGNPTAAISLTDTASTVFNVHATLGYIYSNSLTITGYEGEAKFALGTYGDYETISASSTYYIEGDNEAKIDVEQFVARLVDGSKFSGGSSTVDPTPGTDPDPVTPVHAGTKEDPYTIADAILVAGALAEGSFSAEKVYIVGYIVSEPSYNETFGSYGFKLADTADATGTFEAYSAKLATGVTSIKKGDKVVINGYLKHHTYNGGSTLEIAYNSAKSDSPIISLADSSSTVDPTPGTDPEPASKLEQVKGAMATTVEAGKSYALGLYQKSADKILFANGTLDRFLATTANIAEAATVQVEAAEGGYYIYFLNGTTKKYITLTGSLNSKGNPTAAISLTDTASTVFNVHATLGYIYSNSLTITGYEGEAKFALGTYGDYETISASSTYYIEGDNEAKIDVEQFVARLVDGSKFSGGSSTVDPTPGTDPNPSETAHKGTKEDPYTVADALKVIESLEVKGYTELVYTKGIITSLEYGSYVKNIVIVDEAGSETSLLVYSCNYTDAIKHVAVGDTIVVYGALIKYVDYNNNVIPEISNVKENDTVIRPYPTFAERTIGKGHINVESAENATVAITDNQRGGDNDSTFTFTVTPAEGYEIVTVTINGTKVTASAGLYTGTICGMTQIKVTTKVIGSKVPTLAASISFASTDNRDSQTTDKQVWSANGITVTNDKASSTSNIVNSSNPVKFYKSSKLTIQYTGMIQIVIHCTGASYNSGLDGLTIAGATITKSGNDITIKFESSVDSFVVDSLASQIRVSSIEVYTLQ